MLSAKLNTESGTPPAASTPEHAALASEIRGLMLTKLSVRVESDDLDLFRAGILDSMALVQLIFAIEEHFGLRLPLEEIDTAHFMSVAKIAQFIGGYQQTAAADES